MVIKQFEDKNLSHYSYAIYSKGEVALIDPSRDPQPYYDFANQLNAKIISVIETHPHADFVSSHLEIHKTTGANIYTSKLVGAEYPHQGFDEGDAIILGEISLKAINTPGHSPDSISVLAIDEKGSPHAVFTGDTLFIGDCGRPDLREKAGAITAKREELARQMYRSLREKLMNLPDDVLVYPAHGAGSLCGKGLSQQSHSTIGAEKLSNWSLQEMSEEEFVSKLLENQPFIPKYFPYDVSINRKGAENYKESISRARKSPLKDQSLIGVTIVDTRSPEKFYENAIPGSINLPDDLRFETWLGSIINPEEEFYLIAENSKSADELISRIAKIGYEKQIKEVFLTDSNSADKGAKLNLKELREHPEKFTILDVRNASESESPRYFNNAINIPLHELRERINEIPKDKPIVVHCGGGYRSIVGTGIVKAHLNGNIPVFNLGKAVEQF